MTFFRTRLDMDHIVASEDWLSTIPAFQADPFTLTVHSSCPVDNVTRNLVAMGQRPVTVGLFFSLGHSSIVIGVTIA